MLNQEESMLSQSIIACLEEPTPIGGILMPNHIDTYDDFRAWAHNVGQGLPSNPDDVYQAALATGVDGEGRLVSDLKTASCTFFAGSSMDDIAVWLEDEFGGKQGQ